MNRLRHSPSGYLRYMQMSRTQVFAFVEGKKIDPFFYGKVCDSVCQSVRVSYEICSARELPEGAGGKQVLIGFFDYLRRESALINNFNGKNTKAIFFLDKDVDDFLGKQLCSEHVVYTEYYDVENYLFIEGDIGEAAAACASMDSQLVLSGLGDYEDWRRRVAERWKEWVKFCLFAVQRDIRCECNYGVTSRINAPLHEPVVQALYAQRLTMLKSASGLSSEQFERAFEQVARLVDDLYVRGEHDRIFKGKWYVILLEAEIKTIAGIRPIDSKGLVSRLPSAIAVTLNFDNPWADYFKEPLRRLVCQV